MFITYKYRFINIVISLSLALILYSCYDNPTEPKPEPKQYIPVDTASRYEWTYETGTFPTNDYCVVDTANIYFAGGIAVKYDGAQFITLNMGDNRFYAQNLSAINKDCIFFGGEIRTSMYDYIPAVKRNINGKIDTYILPTDTSESVTTLYGISPNIFWAVSNRDVIYYYNNGTFKTYESPKRWSGYFIYLTPAGKLLMFINSRYSAVSKAVTTVNELIGDKIVFVSADTVNINKVSLIYQCGQDIITMRDNNFCYFDGYHWIKFFNYYDLDPYFLTGIFACGGKSRNEFMFTSITTGFQLLLKDNKWSWEKKSYGPGGYSHPKIYFYDDRIYFLAQYYEAYITYLYKGKLKIH